MLSGLIVWVSSSLAGFPWIFKVFFLGYVALAFLFFLLLDARPMRLPDRPILAIVNFFILASIVLTLAGFLLPQYDPEVEKQKIGRIQASAIEQEQEKRQKEIAQAVDAAKKELLAQLEREGVVQIAKKLPPAEAIPVGLDPKQVAFGKQVYQDFECYNCHKIGGKGGVKRRGPELDNIGNLVSGEMLKKKLLDTYIFATEGFMKEYKKAVMPDNYPELMTEKEMDAVVAYMLTLRDASVKTPKPIFDVKRPAGVD